MRHALATVRALAVGAALALSLVGASGCAREGSELSVYAASSLTEAFTDLGDLYRRAHPHVPLSLTFSGSQVLRVQIEEGAPADIFASANPEHVQALVREQLMQEALRFATNELVIIVPRDNPAGIDSFMDLPRAERIVLGTPAVPIGRYARDVLAAADSLVRPGFGAEVMAHVVSEESNVRLARSKVELGEADASIVYRTDAVASERVRMISIPDEVNVKAVYLIGAVARAGESQDSVAEASRVARAELARDWLALVASPEGRIVLERHGFVVR